MTEFVDSNVLVYSHDSSERDKRELARSLLVRLWEERAGAMSIQVLQEFVVATTTKVPSPIDADIAARIIGAYASWTIHRPDAMDVIEAMTIAERNGISFWDAMIVRSASRLGCQILWSEDLNPGQTYEGVEVRNPVVGAS
ncbi:MAG: PIN domain-containing protein [Actinomycetota bacterium]